MCTRVAACPGVPLPHSPAAGAMVSMMVVAADIRKSTFLMKEAIDLRAFAEAIGDYFDATEKFIRANHGWLDKFVGDGFLAYWLYDDNDTSPREQLIHVMDMWDHVLSEFDRHMIPRLWSSPDCRGSRTFGKPLPT
jgi:class 3 adenylate cyclase